MKGNSHPRRGGRLMLVLALPVLLLLLVFASASGAEPAASGVDAAPAAQPDSSGLQRLVEATGGRAVFSQNSATGKVGFLRITGEEGLSLAAGESVEAESAAFFQQYGSIFGISDAAAELTSLGATTDAVGMQHLSYRQGYQGVPGFAAIPVSYTHLDVYKRQRLAPRPGGHPVHRHRLGAGSSGDGRPP